MIDTDEAVARTLESRATRRPMAPFSESVPGLDLARAYEVQDALRRETARRGERSPGWKLGATNAAGQAAMGVREPLAGFLRARRFANGARVPASEFVIMAAEAEMAFRLRTRLAGPGVDLDQAKEAIEGALAALEMPDNFLTGKPTPSDLVATSLIANGFVLGDLLVPLAELDTANERVVFEHRGAVVHTTSSAEVLGDPLRGVVWLANHLATRGLALEAGDVVLTGAIGAAVRPAVGDSVRARFAHLGTVELTVVA
jgi:2-keto-4-pentenoate hydratase